MPATNDTALVSVIIPTYNAQAYLRETLDSVLGQSHAGVEVIVVDDGSTDATTSIVADHYPSVRLISQRNAGVCVARNTGLAAASGQFVCFLDQDDVWHREKLARQVQCLQVQPDAAAVACRFFFWHQDAPGHWPAPGWQSDPGLLFVPGFDGWTYHHFLYDCWALTSSVLLRTEAVRRCGGFDPAWPFAEEWDLWLRLSRVAPFLLLDWQAVAYRQHPTQGSRSVRDVDYRCELLLATARENGLASPDGQAIDARRFADRIATYRKEYGYFHLLHGDRWTGVQAMFDAWWRRPTKMQYLMAALAATLGWRPSA